jgi:hypothetical protein
MSKGTTMTTLVDATRRLTECLFESIRRGGGFHPEEADPVLNDASRAVIKAMAAANEGESWLGRVNLYKGRPEDDDGRHEPLHWETPLWKWTGRPVCNFGASFVVPRHDAELERLIRERGTATYTTTTADYERVTAIHERLDAVGGVRLHWS